MKMNLQEKYPRLFKLYENINEDYLGLLAAGVAFYFLMAAFPALAAAISLYGIFSDPKFVADQIHLLSQFLPPDALNIFIEQTETLLKASGGALGFGFVVSTLFAIYSATKGVGALIKGLNIAYNEKEKRGMLRLSMTGFALTGGLLVYLLLALTLIAGLPAILNFVHLDGMSPSVYLKLRWPLLFLTAILGLEILYSYAPCHQKFIWRWISWGSFTATIVWIAGSIGFSLFVTNFGNYNQTYGSISAIIILLLWFWMSAMTILLGAEINHLFDRNRGELPDKELNLEAGSETKS